MKCPVCGNEHKNPVCEKCGFDETKNVLKYRTLCPISEEDTRNILGENNYWNYKIRELEIYAVVHYYTEDGDKLIYHHSGNLLLAKGEAFKDNEIIWCKEEFPRVDAMDILTICLLIRNKNSERKIHVMIDNPYGDGRWKAGIKLMNRKKMTARFVLGPIEGNDYQESDDFYLEL